MNKRPAPEILRYWQNLGFAEIPDIRILNQGTRLFRASANNEYSIWGGPQGAYYTFIKPKSVLEAEVMCNVVDFGNPLTVVSTFVVYGEMTTMWVGEILHGEQDLHVRALQAWTPSPLETRRKNLRIHGPSELLTGPTRVAMRVAREANEWDKTIEQRLEAARRNGGKFPVPPRYDN